MPLKKMPRAYPSNYQAVTPSCGPFFCGRFSVFNNISGVIERTKEKISAKYLAVPTFFRTFAASESFVSMNKASSENALFMADCILTDSRSLFGEKAFRKLR